MSRVRTAAAAAATVVIAAGLPLMASGPAQAATGVRAWDFNGDGFADLAVGAPGSDVAGEQDAGVVHIFMADGSGNGTYSTSTLWTQETDGVAGSAQGPGNNSLVGGQFGYAMTSDDFDGDGFADLAVAANGTDVDGQEDVGSITILWGSAAGITATGSKVLSVRADNGTVSANSFWGDGLAAGDMDNDGKAELAVGGPGRQVVKVFAGATKANFGTTVTGLSETSLDVGKKENNDLFGEALAMGDFDNDGNADLIIGVPYDSEDRGWAVGAADVVYGGGANGPDTSRAARWSPDATGVKAGPHHFMTTDFPDSFGRTFGVGDFNDDGFDDVAVGAPGTPVDGHEDAGAVEVLVGSASGLNADGDWLLTKDSTSISGSPVKSGLFGASLDGGRVNGKADILAVGSAQEAVWILPAGLGAGSTFYTQDSTGLASSKETGDAFGAFVRFLDARGSGQSQSLAIGAPGESFTGGSPANAGALHVLRPGANFPVGTSSMFFTEDTAGVAGSAKSGEGFGWLGDSH